MKFVDANVFVYGYARPARILNHETQEQKKKAAKILEKLKDGFTSVVHLSEVANVMQSMVGREAAAKSILSILASPYVIVASVSPNDYALAAQLSERINVDVNDCLAIVLMRANGIKEIYSFDKAFDAFPGIKRLEE